MLVTEAVGNHTRQCYQCLDLLQVRFANRAVDPVEDAVLLEVWETGGLLQTDAAAVAGCPISLFDSGRAVAGKVVSCCKDDYGYLVEFTVDDAMGWFPAFRPAFLLPEPSTLH